MASHCRIAIIAVLISLFAASGASQSVAQGAEQETAQDSFQIGTRFTDADILEASRFIESVYYALAGVAN